MQLGKLRSAARRQVRTRLARRGRQLAPWPHPDSLAWSLKLLLRELQIQHVLDVGAHHGEFVQRLRSESGWSGPVTSFECAPRALEVLRPAAARDPLWAIHEVALGDTDGEATLTDYDQGQLASLRPITDFARESWSFENARSFTVPVRRLEAVITGELGRTFLKVDTQGHDLAVLAGARGVMPSVQALLLEIPVHALYAGTGTFHGQVAHLDALGFEPIGFWPVQRLAVPGKSEDQLRVVEFDGLFVRKALPASPEGAPAS